MPKPYGANYSYKEWVMEFERFDTNKETILIGHSTGGGFLVRWF